MPYLSITVMTGVDFKIYYKCFTISNHHHHKMHSQIARNGWLCPHDHFTVKMPQPWVVSVSEFPVQAEHKALTLSVTLEIFWLCVSPSPLCQWHFRGTPRLAGSSSACSVTESLGISGTDFSCAGCYSCHPTNSIKAWRYSFAPLCLQAFH